MTGVNEYLLKICIIGRNTKLNHKFGNLTSDNKWETNYLPILGYDVPTKKVTVDKKPIKLIIMITAGEPFFDKQRPSFYRGSSAAIFLYDKGDKDLFRGIYSLYKNFKKVISSPVPTAIVGIKTETEEITWEEGEKLAKELKCLFFETGLRDKKRVENIFETLAKQAIKN